MAAKLVDYSADVNCLINLCQFIMGLLGLAVLLPLHFAGGQWMLDGVVVGARNPPEGPVVQQECAGMQFRPLQVLLNIITG